MKFKVKKLSAVNIEISKLEQSHQDLLKSEYEKIENLGI
mgnify:FL=1